MTPNNQMNIIAIDPGPQRSAWVSLTSLQHIIDMGIHDNPAIIDILKDSTRDWLVLEMIASFGMPVGKEVFETCVWIGRFIEAFGKAHILFTRNEVKMHLCHSPRAKDANIRQALLDRFGPVGTKKKPGLLYGVKADIWSALAVAVTFYDLQKP